MIDLRLGRWQDAISDVETVDAIVTDPPYSERTHSGHGVAVDHLGAADNARRKVRRQAIDYDAWSPDTVRRFVAHWSPRTRGWFCAISDHVLMYDWADALDDAGRYVFPPLPIVEVGSRVRLTGDGPSSWTCWLVVARPRTPEFVRWGTLPGAYIGSGKGDREHIGGKDSGIMRAIVRDYTRPGDLVCDPCMGAGTTALAAGMEGRKFVGAEMDPLTFTKAQRRLGRGFTMPLFHESPSSVQAPLKIGGVE